MFYKNFGIKKNSVTAITGSGGKTSLMFYLAEELSKIGKVLITTTTKIFVPDKNQYENLFLINENKKTKGTGKNIDILGEKIENGKIISPLEKNILFLKQNYDYIIYEADGSKQKSMKFWRDDEPCILSCTDKIIGVANIKVLGQSFSEENIHRFNMYTNSNKFISEKIISKEIFKDYLINGKFFQNSSKKMKKILFLNGVEKENEIISAFDFAFERENFIFGSVKEKKIYSPRKISAVVMGSGEAKRFGSNKLLEKINGVPMIEILLQKLVQIPFKNIFVTYKDEEILKICQKYSVVPLKNEKYFMGQSESIKLGVSHTEDEDIIFFTGDMPFITVETIKKIISISWEKNLITIPCAVGKRFSPVIFSSRYREKLLELSGDTGGREIIRYETDLNFAEFKNQTEFLDIDTKEEFDKAVIKEKGDKNV